MRKNMKSLTDFQDISLFQMDAELYELQSEHEQLKLSYSLLNHAHNSAKAEIEQLKKQVQSLAMENSTLEQAVKQKKRYSETTKKKWQYYHQHKDKVRADMNERPHWHIIKRMTDEMYQNSRSIEKQ